MDLTTDFRGRLLRHMLRLSPDDRYMRFFTPASDYFITTFVDKLLTSKTDALFVKYSEDGQAIIGVVNVCLVRQESKKLPAEYELAVSVDKEHRRAGIGYELFEQAFKWLTNIGAKRVFMSCLTTNLAMRLIVQKFNMNMSREEDENLAELKLPGLPNLVGIMVGDAENSVAFYDLLYKRQVHAFWNTAYKLIGYDRNRGSSSSSENASQNKNAPNTAGAN